MRPKNVCVTCVVQVTAETNDKILYISQSIVGVFPSVGYLFPPPFFRPGSIDSVISPRGMDFSEKTAPSPVYFNSPPGGDGYSTTSIFFEPTFFKSPSTASMMSGKKKLHEMARRGYI